MNRVLQPHPLIVLGLNVWMGTAAGADELVQITHQSTHGSRSDAELNECAEESDLELARAAICAWPTPSTLVLWCFVFNPHEPHAHLKIRRR